MGLREEALDFVDRIPDSKLIGGFPDSGSTIHKDTEFRLDMQNVTSTLPQNYNIQIQCNKHAKNSSVLRAANRQKKSKHKGGSVCKILVPILDLPPPDVIKQLLRDSVNAFFDTY